MKEGARLPAYPAPTPASIPLRAPVTAVGSRPFEIASERHDRFREQIGWPEMVRAIARVRDGPPAEDRDRAGIYAGNYGAAAGDVRRPG
jgi:hypothetical protein